MRETITRITFPLLILLFLPVITHAGQVSPLSPDEVVKLVNHYKLGGLNKVWKELGIESELFEYVKPDRVERYNEELDGREGTEAILRISNFSWVVGQYLTRIRH